MNERELDRNAARRLAIIRHAREVTGNVAQTCRYYGISRQVFYVWYRRYEAEGLAGLRDRSTRPAHCPHETSSEVVGKIIYLRTNYHFGPEKISMYLKRYHDVQVSKSGVWRILKRLDLNRLPASQRYKRHDRKWKRYEKPMPGHAVQVDVKFIAPLTTASRKKYYQFTAIDDCTRLRVLRIYDRLNQKTAIQFADFLLDKFPFRVETIQTDNGSEFQSSFHWHLLDRGVRHIYIKPATPRLNGKVERSQCATRRAVVSPVQPGGTRREVPGSDGLPGAERLMGTRACQLTRGRVQAYGTVLWGTRVTWRKLDCLNSSLQKMEVHIRRKDA